MINAQTTTPLQTSLEYWQAVESMNDMLAETITMASDDFLEMCKLLKNCNVKLNDLQAEISAAIRELQHIDFLRQKLGHVRDLHLDLLQTQETKTIGIENSNMYATHGLIFKVNYYQLMAAHEDYIKVVRSVQSTIRKIKEHNVLLISFNAPIFSNRFQIDDNFRTLSSSLESLVHKYFYTVDINTSLLADQISAKYTMESERVVVRWCVSNTGSDDDFIDYYKSSNLNDNIELF